MSPRSDVAGSDASLTPSRRNFLKWSALLGGATALGGGLLLPRYRDLEEPGVVGGLRLGDAIAAAARETVLGRLSASIELDVLVVNRQGRTVGHAGS